MNFLSFPIFDHSPLSSLRVPRLFVLLYSLILGKSICLALIREFISVNFNRCKWIVWLSRDQTWTDIALKDTFYYEVLIFWITDLVFRKVYRKWSFFKAKISSVYCYKSVNLSEIKSRNKVIKYLKGSNSIVPDNQTLYHISN